MTAAVATPCYLQRLLRLELSEPDPSAITLEQYHRQMQGITPAEVIEPSDTAAQVLFLLTLDTERRDRLAHAAVAHGWSAPEPRPWDSFVHQAAPPHLQRVGLTVDATGRFTWLRRGWPDLFDQLTQALPRLRDQL